MPEVYSFRPTAEEVALVEATRRRLGLKSRTEALRYLVHQAAEAEREDAMERLFAWRLPPEFQSPDRSITSEEIDEVVYGEHLRHDPGS